MDTPEPVQNARESFGDINYDIDPSLSHVRFTEDVMCENVISGEEKVLFEEGDELEVQYLDYYESRGWLLTVRKEDGNTYDFCTDQYAFEWVYDSEVPEKAREAQEKLAEAQDLLDDIWGETGDSSAEEATRRVVRTREIVERNYL